MKNNQDPTFCGYTDDPWLAKLKFKYEEGYEAGVVDEREACAKLCEEMWTGYADLGAICASAIRARETNKNG